MSDHNRPLFISAIIDENVMTGVMVDNAPTVNNLQKRILLVLEHTLVHIIYGSLIIQGFNQSEQRLLLKIMTKTTSENRGFRRILGDQRRHSLQALLDCS